MVKAVEASLGSRVIGIDPLHLRVSLDETRLFRHADIREFRIWVHVLDDLR